jgi:hypothetical protein
VRDDIPLSGFVCHFLLKRISSFWFIFPGIKLPRKNELQLSSRKNVKIASKNLFLFLLLIFLTCQYILNQITMKITVSTSYFIYFKLVSNGSQPLIVGDRHHSKDKTYVRFWQSNCSPEPGHRPPVKKHFPRPATTSIIPAYDHNIHTTCLKVYRTDHLHVFVLRLQRFRPGDNFTNVLRKAFTCPDPKSAKRRSEDLTIFLRFWDLFTQKLLVKRWGNRPLAFKSKTSYHQWARLGFGTWLGQHLHAISEGDKIRTCNSTIASQVCKPLYTETLNIIFTLINQQRQLQSCILQLRANPIKEIEE